jgi:hypothetical protein
MSITMNKTISNTQESYTKIGVVLNGAKKVDKSTFYIARWRVVKLRSCLLDLKGFVWNN